eukprot:gene1853-994_t
MSNLFGIEPGQSRKNLIYVVSTVFVISMLLFTINIFAENRKKAKKIKIRSTTYKAAWTSLSKRKLPTWFSDAKFGIFIHWGIYSVPAFAPPIGKFGTIDWNTWFKNCPYAEWYYNTLHINGSKTQEYHKKNYGNMDYLDFIPMFNKAVEKWDAAKMASIFKNVGAKYVVLTTKHHDGVTLWPSKIKNQNREGKPMISRDIVGELSKHVKENEMKMGLYYSGGADWSFFYKPITKKGQWKLPDTKEYLKYSNSHFNELIDKYNPDILWNDLGYFDHPLTQKLFAKFYNKNPNGIINDRFTKKWFDFTTPEYSEEKSIVSKKWESCRGLGYSFGYNKIETEEHTIKINELIRLLITIVSKNGNLLLNVGPNSNGEIPEIQLKPLLGLGKWLDVNGESIFKTRPWKEHHIISEENFDLFFTQKKNGDITKHVYVFIFTKDNKSKIVSIPIDLLPEKKFFLNYKIMRIGFNSKKIKPEEETSNFYKFKIPNDVKNDVFTLKFSI